MTRKRRESSNLLKKYNKMKTISSFVWLFSGLAVFAFGVYYREIFELVFGILAIIYGIFNLRIRNTSLTAIARIERNKLSFLAVCIIVFSLVNPIGNLAVIYDIYKRDFVIKGGFDEKES